MTKLFITLAFLAGATAATQTAPPPEPILHAWDVAEDHTRHRAPMADPAGPYGTFAVAGYVYPVGTLRTGRDGVSADGTPAFPDEVLGTWTRDGIVTADGISTSRQTLVLQDGDVLISEGLDADRHKPTRIRAVTGGTGRFAAHDGDVRQILLDRSAHGGVQARFVLAGPDFNRRTVEAE
ncbi:MAG: hypothetical protein AAF390_12155 [Pseudomonadota bacterium]